MIPENILNEFSSYQVQMNILATYDFDVAATLCNDYITLEKIKNESGIPKYQQTVNTESLLHKTLEDIRANVFLDKLVNENSSLATILRRRLYDVSGGKIVWLIDTSEDADLLFDSVEFTTYCTPNPNNSNGNPSLGLQLEGELQITEVATAKFLDAFSSLRPKNTTTFKALTLILAPTVYGFTSSDSQTPHVVPLNPVAFLVTNITSNYTDQGGKYNISLVGITNGFANLSAQSDINQSIKINLGPAPRMLLSQALDTYQAALNTQYEKYREQHRLDSSFVKIKYQIEIDPNVEQIPTAIAVDFTDVPYSDAIYAIDNINGFSTTLNSSDAILSFKNGSIIDGIQEILKHSTRVVNDSVPKKIKTSEIANSTSHEMYPVDGFTDWLGDLKETVGEGKDRWAKLYETTTEFSISSKPTVITKITKENDTLIIKYTVVKTYVVSSDDPNGENINSNDYVTQIVECLTGDNKTNIFKNPIFKNLLYYDYLFTGRNVDVLDYTMNINQGTVFVNAVKWEQALNLGNSSISVSAVDQTSEYVPNLVRKDVPLIGTSAHTICNNYYTGPKQFRSISRFISTTANPEITASYYDRLNRYSVTETINQEITVTGNPILWGSFVDSASGVSNNTDHPISRWDVFPPLMYINIRYPTDPNYFRGTDVTTGYSDRTSETFAPFWYRGLHRIFAIKTIINGNQFSHIITTFPLMTTKQAEQKISDVLQEEAAAELEPENTEATPINGSKSNSTHALIVARKTKTATGADVTKLLPAEAKFTAAPGTPLSGTLILTSGYLPMRRLKKRASSHFAIDLRASVGTSVFSMTGGRVYAVEDRSDDSFVKIITDKNVIITYLHVTPIVKKDDVIVPNQKIATIRKFSPNSEYNKEHLHVAIEYKGVRYNPEQVMTITQTNNTPDAVLHFKEKK